MGSAPSTLGQQSHIVPDSGDPATGNGPIYRALAAAEGLLPTFYDDATTLHECWTRGLRVAGPRPCLGTRPIIGDKPGPYQWRTYNEVNVTVEEFSSGLLALDLLSESDDGHLMMGHYLRNCAEWVISEQATYRVNGVVVPLYDTFGPSAAGYVLRETGMGTLLCTHDTAAKVIALKADAPEDCATVKVIVVVDGGPEDMVAKAEAVGLKVYTFDQVCAAGRDSPASARPPVPKDLATICYTSGSTGDPKGVMLNHGNIVSLAASSQHYGIVLDINDVHLSYLPMAHMFERFIVANGLSSGFSMGFYMGDAKKIVDDLRALRPTIFPSVPRLFTRIHDSIIGKVTAAGGLKATMFGMALDAKLRGLDDNILHHSLWDAIIFNKLKASIGLDRCRFMITGSAPIGNHVLRFLRAAFGIPVAQGYGLTETSAGTCITDLKDHSTDAHTGPPCVCSEVKLIDVVDMGYHVTDTLHGEEKKEGTDEVIKAGMACCGRGEVCIRGVNVFSGYYKHPELTSGALDADGWLHTGDIGLWHPDGVLQIIDRRKNVFKLAQGEYIAPEKIENVVLKSRMVAQAFVYGDSFKTFVVAVIVPDEPTVMEWAKLHGVSGTFEELCKNDGLRKALLEDMQKMATEAKLSGFERVRRIIIECEPWTVENDMLTPTFKSIRAKFMPRYKTHLDALYE